MYMSKLVSILKILKDQQLAICTHLRAHTHTHTHALTVTDTRTHTQVYSNLKHDAKSRSVRHIHVHAAHTI